MAEASVSNQEQYDGLSEDEKVVLALVGQGVPLASLNPVDQKIALKLADDGWVDAIQATERHQSGWIQVSLYDEVIDDLKLCAHIIPAGDLTTHIVDEDGTCWCEPNLDIEDLDYYHNAADGREDYETARRKPH